MRPARERARGERRCCGLAIALLLATSAGRAASTAGADAAAAVDAAADSGQLGADVIEITDEVSVSDVAAPADATATADVAAPGDATATDVLHPADVTAADDSAALPDAVTCGAMPELCDGIDNNCNGLTDEGFLAITKQGWMPVGSSCGDGPLSGIGFIVCKDLQTAGCNLSHFDLDVTLAPPGAQLSSLTANGGFVNVSAQLPIAGITVDPGSLTFVPNGSSPLALDVDGDGDLDLVWLDGLTQATLWTQTAPWQFTASPLAMNSKGFVSMAALADGANTQLVLGGGAIALVQRDASGQFVDVAAAHGLTMPAGTQYIQHLLPADVNNDGLLDIVAGIFSCSALYPALYVWLDRGDGFYVESAQALGMDLHASVWSNLFTDLDGNGQPALMVMTEGCEPHPGNALYVQQPLDAPLPMYATATLLPIFTAPSAPTCTPMGGSVADVNGDGVMDYLLSEIELRDYFNGGGNMLDISTSDLKITMALSNHLLLSQPNGQRKQAGLQAGLWAPLSTTGAPMVSWTPIWSDLDHDGHLDLLLSHACEYFAWTNGQAGSMRPVCFRNDGTQHFSDQSAAFGLPAQHDGRAMVLADLDGDGDEDLAIGGQGVAPMVLRNDIVHGGSDVRVRLRGQASNHWGLLAKIKLKTNLRTLTMEHNVQASTQTMAMPLSHFALQAGETPQSLTVVWPSGWTSQQALTKPGNVEVVEPQLFALSTRWSPGGLTPVQVQATQFSADGQPQGNAQCSIELAAGAKGQWQGPIDCAGSTCTRTWLGNAATQGGADALVIGCGGQTWHVRPRIGY